MSKGHTGRRAMAAVLLTQFLLGCTGWQVQDLTPEQVIEEHRPRKILITTVEDSKIELQSPIAVVGDTLTGWMGRRPNPLTPVKLPLDSVKTVAVDFDRQPDGVARSTPRPRWDFEGARSRADGCVGTSPPPARDGTHRLIFFPRRAEETP
jgi:hypothetical protein